MTLAELNAKRDALKVQAAEALRQHKYEEYDRLTDELVDVVLSIRRREVGVTRNMG